MRRVCTWCEKQKHGFCPFAPAPVEVAEILGEESYRRTKVLICAPSNSALDEIVLRIMKTGVYGPNGTAYSPTLVRVGVNVHHSAGEKTYVRVLFV